MQEECDKLKDISLNKLSVHRNEEHGRWQIKVSLPDDEFQIIKGYEGLDLFFPSEELAEFILQEIRTFFFKLKKVDIGSKGEIEGMAGAYLIESMKDDAIKDFESPQFRHAFDNGLCDGDVYFNFCDVFIQAKSAFSQEIESSNGNSSEQGIVIHDSGSEPIPLSELFHVEERLFEFKKWLTDIFNGVSPYDIVDEINNGTLDDNFFYWLSRKVPDNVISTKKALDEAWGKIRLEAKASGNSARWDELIKNTQPEIISGAQSLGFQYGSHLLALFCLSNKKSEQLFSELMMHLKPFLYLEEAYPSIEYHQQIAVYESSYAGVMRYCEFFKNANSSSIFERQEDKYLEYKATFRKPWPRPPEAEKKNAQGQNLYKSGGKYFESLNAIERSIEYSVLKTIVGFLNSEEGGRLIIGIHERGTILTNVGIEFDGFSDEDEYARVLSAMIDRDIGSLTNPTPSSIFTTNHVNINFYSHGGVRMCVCEVSPYTWPENGSPAYLARNYKKASAEEKEPRFFVRKPASTEELTQLQLTAFMAERRSK